MTCSPCNCKECLNDADPHFFRLDTLYRFIEKGRYQKDCEKSCLDVDIRSLLEGITASKEEYSVVIPSMIEEYFDNDKIQGEKEDDEIEDQNRRQSSDIRLPVKNNLWKTFGKFFSRD